MDVSLSAEGYEVTESGERIRCCECGGWDYIRDGAAVVRHSSRCDRFTRRNPATRVYVVETVVAVPEEPPKPVDAGRAALMRDAKAGLSGRHDASDLVDAVKAGDITVSDAMNSDV